MRTMLRVMLAALLIGAGAARAEVIVYAAILDGASESPPVVSQGTGTATVTFDLTALTVRVQAQFAGLTGVTTVAHIHCCTADPFAGNVGVASQVPTFAGFPAGVTAGSFDQLFDLDAGILQFFNPAFVNANGGTGASALAALLAGLDSGRAYFNIHSSFSGSGEIRGFFVRLVPEPAPVALLAIALLAFAFVRTQALAARSPRAARR